MGKNKRRLSIHIEEGDLPKERLPFPRQTEKIHKHRKDRRSQITKKDLKRMADEDGGD